VSEAPADFLNNLNFRIQVARHVRLGWAQMTKKVPHTQPRPSQPPSKSLLATEKNGLLNRLPAKVSFSIFD
jgi:hypothetical protein